MSAKLTHHHVTGFDVTTLVHAIRITASVLHPDHSSGRSIHGKFEVDLYPHGTSDPLAPNRLELLKQLSESANAAYRAEYVKEHGMTPRDEHPLIAADEENR